MKLTLNEVLEKMKTALRALGVALQFYANKPKPMQPEQPIDTPPAVVVPSPTPPIASPDTLEPWTDPISCRHNVRVICDQEGLTVKQKNDLSATVHCESNYNPACIHPNLVSGKVTSTDYGICQINDYYHIGPGKDFPSVQDVLDNPEACVRWMARQWKRGNGKLWVCYSKGLYRSYAA